MDKVAIKKQLREWNPHYKLGKEVGSGGFANIYEIYNASSYCKTVLKVIDLDSLIESRDPDERKYLIKKYQEKTINEVNFLHLLKRAGAKNVAEIVNSRFFPDNNNPSSFFIIMKKYSHTAEEFFKQNKNQTIYNIAAMMYDISICLDYCQKCNILHHDISPDNILIDNSSDELRFCLTDFGISRDMTGSSGHTPIRTPTKQAYEPLYKEYNGYSLDYYMLGATAFKLITGIYVCNLQREQLNSKLREAKVPYVFRKIIMKTLSEIPTSNYQNAHDLYTDLKKFLQEPESIYINLLDQIKKPIALFDDKVISSATALNGYRNIDELIQKSKKISEEKRRRERKASHKKTPLLTSAKPKMKKRENSNSTIHSKHSIIAYILVISTIVFFTYILMISIFSVPQDKSDNSTSTVATTTTEPIIENNQNGCDIFQNEYGYAYRQPEELGDDFTSGIFSMDGCFFQVPFPVQAAVDRGMVFSDWTFDMTIYGQTEKDICNSIFDVSKTYAEPNTSYTVWMINPTEEKLSVLSVELFNPTNQKQLASNCVITNVYIYNDSNFERNIALPQLGKVPFTKESLKELADIFPDVHYRESLGIDVYSFDTSFGYIRIDWDTDQDIYDRVILISDESNLF